MTAEAGFISYSGNIQGVMKFAECGEKIFWWDIRKSSFSPAGWANGWCSATCWTFNGGCFLGLKLMFTCSEKNWYWLSWFLTMILITLDKGSNAKTRRSFIMDLLQCRRNSSWNFKEKNCSWCFNDQTSVTMCEWLCSDEMSSRKPVALRTSDPNKYIKTFIMPDNREARWTMALSSETWRQLLWFAITSRGSKREWSNNAWYSSFVLKFIVRFFWWQRTISPGWLSAIQMISTKQIKARRERNFPENKHSSTGLICSKEVHSRLPAEYAGSLRRRAKMGKIFNKLVRAD